MTSPVPTTTQDAPGPATGLRPGAEDQPPIACDLGRLSPAERARLDEVAPAVFARAVGVRVQADGYALHLGAPNLDLARLLADFVVLDHVCCPFLRHSIDVEPASGGVWLRLTEGPGAREAVTDDVASLLPPELASAVRSAQLGDHLGEAVQGG